MVIAAVSTCQRNNNDPISLQRVTIVTGESATVMPVKVKAKIFNCNMELALDTVAHYNFIKASSFNRLQAGVGRQLHPEPRQFPYIDTAGNLILLNKVKLQVRLNHCVCEELFVIEDNARFSGDIKVGSSFMKKYSCNLLFSQHQLVMNNCIIPFIWE